MPGTDSSLSIADFSVGDRVRAVSHDSFWTTGITGDEGEVVRIDPFGDTVQIQFDGAHRSLSRYPYRLVNLTTGKGVDAPAAEPTVGALYRVLVSRPDYCNAEPGDVIRLTRQDYATAWFYEHVSTGDGRALPTGNYYVRINSTNVEPVTSADVASIPSDHVRAVTLKAAKQYGWCSVAQDGLEEMGINPDVPVAGIFGIGDKVKRIGSTSGEEYRVVGNGDKEFMLLEGDSYLIEITDRIRERYIRVSNATQDSFPVSVDLIRSVTLRLADANGHGEEARAVLRSVGIDPDVKENKPGEFENGDLVKWHPPHMDQDERFRVRYIRDRGLWILVNTKTLDVYVETSPSSVMVKVDE